MAAVVTNLAASVGGLTWCILDYRLERKWSTVGFCSGVISGLVAITPGSGFVPAWAAVIFGVVGGAACNYGTKLKFLLHIDDSLDIFAIHGIGGLVGDLLTGLFAADYIVHLDGASTIDGGWINHHWIQLAYQLCDGVSGMAYSFVVSCAILFVLNFIPGLHLRASEQEEIMGMDETEIGEFAYDVSTRPIFLSSLNYLRVPMLTLIFLSMWNCPETLSMALKKHPTERLPARTVINPKSLRILPVLFKCADTPGDKNFP